MSSAAPPPIRVLLGLGAAMLALRPVVAGEGFVLPAAVVEGEVPGDYRIAYLSLVGFASAGQALDALVLVRAGKPREVIPVSTQRSLAPGGDLAVLLAAEGGSDRWTLTCQLHEPSRDGRGAGHRTTLVLDLAAASPAGTWTGEHGRKGTVAVRLADQAALDRANGIAAGRSWPCYNGPSSGGSVPRGARPLVDDLAKARLAWRSELEMPTAQGNTTSVRYGVGGSLEKRIGGGSASPVIADGRVIVKYHVPAGTRESPVAQTIRAQFAAEKAKGRYAGIAELPKAATARWLTGADDVVACLDAASGRLLWRTTFPLHGVNWQDHKSGPCNNTAAVAGGRVVSMGSSGRLYCLDLASGKPLWQTRGGLLEAGRQKDGTWTDYHGGWSARDFNTAPIAIGDAFLVPDHRGATIAYDAASGAELWRGVGGNSAVPVRVILAGAELVALYGRDASGRDVVRLHEPRSGAVRGEVAITLTAMGLAADGDLVLGFAPNGSGKGGKGQEEADGATCVAWRAGAGGLAEVWRCSTPYASGYTVPCISDGKVMLSGPARSELIDLQTGKRIAGVDAAGAGNSGHVFAAGERWFISHDGKHSFTRISMLGLAGGALQVLGVAPWCPPHLQTTGYHKPMQWPIVDGRIFVRGADGIYCYDLRAGDG